MLRISKRFLLAAALLASLFAAAEDTLIAPDRIVQDGGNYKTHNVSAGVYEKKGQYGAGLYFPTRYEVRYEGAKARFVEYAVKHGSEVRAGDLIATFSIDRDEVAVTEKRLALTRAAESREEGLKARQEEIALRKKELLEETDPLLREVGALRVRGLEIALEKFDFESAANVEGLRDSLDELLASYENQRVYAPADGVVDSVTYLRDGEFVYDGTLLAVIYDPYDILFTVNDESGSLRYNMPVTISVGPNKDRLEAPGRVVAAYNVLPGKSAGKTCFIRATEYNQDEVKSLTRPLVAYTTVRLENVFVVPKNALTLFGGKYYAYKLSPDGMVSKRNVTYAALNASVGVWVTDGLSEGDVLILD